MQKWRDRGFVPDSDNEELSDDDGERVSSVTKDSVSVTNEGVSTAQENKEARVQHLKASKHSGQSVTSSLDDRRQIRTFSSDSEKENDAPVAARDSVTDIRPGSRVNQRHDKPLLTYSGKKSRPVGNVQSVGKSHVSATNGQPRDDLARSASSLPRDADDRSQHHVLRTEANDHGEPTENHEPPQFRGTSPADSLPGQQHLVSTNERSMYGRLPGEDLFAQESPQPMQRARSFRPRKAIQVHPYMIESERYRQSWKARGLVPVRMTVNAQETQGCEAAPTIASESIDRQNRETLETLLESPTSSLSSLPDMFSSPEGTQSPQAAIPMNEDELPDVHHLLQGRFPNAQRHHSKRRRVTTTPPSMKTGLQRTMSPRLPPTPPITSAVSSVDPATQDRPRFRLPEGHAVFGSRDLDLFSSDDEPMSARNRTLNRPAQIDVPEQGTNLSPTSDLPTPNSPSGSEAQQSSGTGSDEDREFEIWRKKLKGVLPASWLRLDMKAQKQSSPSKRNPVFGRGASTNLRPAKGVAQTRLRTTPRPPQEMKQEHDLMLILHVIRLPKRLL